MRKFYTCLGALFILLSLGTLKAQTTITYTSDNELGSGTNYDPRLLIHYTVEQLDEMKANDPAEYNAIVYYHTQSYFLEITGCFECQPVDASHFDITKYEDLRHISTTRVYNNVKEGWKLTLISIDNLEYKLAIHQLRKEYNFDYK